MSKASRKYKEKYGTTLYEYRRVRRLMQSEDKNLTQGFRELRDFHKKFFIENSWIPKEQRRQYMYSPEFWNWCYKRINRYRRNKKNV